MILTFTANPSIDCTMVLPTPLTRGAVHRLDNVSRAAGGKGINVSVAAHLAGRPTLAVFPAPHNDAFIRLLLSTGVAYEFVSSDQTVRTNVTITEPDGTTTKLNGPGAAISADTIAVCEDTLLEQAPRARWAVLAGSLPPGAPRNWYSTIAQKLREVNPDLCIAIDTSDAPLRDLMEDLESARPTLIKPNGEELGQAVGVDGAEIERQAAHGDVSGAVHAARILVQRGAENVLVTLGASGAVLVRNDAAWSATPPPITAVSTVGAGDSSLAGFVMARTAGLDYPDALRNAVAYGSAAAALPGTQIPSPEDIRPSQVIVSPFSE